MMGGQKWPPFIGPSYFCDNSQARGSTGVIWERGRLVRPGSNAGTGETPAPPGLLRAYDNSQTLLLAHRRSIAAAFTLP